MDYQNNNTPYPPPPPQPPYQQNNSNGMAIAALVCGIVGVVFCWTYFALLASIAALILGIMSRKRLPAGKTGMATAGLVLGIVGIALFILMIACVVCAVGMFAANDWGGALDWGNYGF